MTCPYNPDGPHARFPEGAFVVFRGSVATVVDKGHGVPPGLLPVWLGTTKPGTNAPLMTYVPLDEVTHWRGGIPVRMLAPPSSPGADPCSLPSSAASSSAPPDSSGS